MIAADIVQASGFSELDQIAAAQALEQPALQAGSVMSTATAAVKFDLRRA